MATRIAVGKKTRFEVFKRDSFTCQYCGAKAPDVILHVDHIRPVADGGGNDPMNLVTACSSCNAGKGARLLDDRSALERQREQIEELQERREQLDMMLEWRDALEKTKSDTVDLIGQRLEERGRYVPNESGRANIRRWLKRFTFDEVLGALDEAFDLYMKWAGDEPDKDAWELAFKKIPAIASLRRQSVEKPYIRQLAYIQGILRRRFRDYRGKYVLALEEIMRDGVALEQMESLAKQADNWVEYCDLCRNVINAKTQEPTDGAHS